MAKRFRWMIIKIPITHLIFACVVLLVIIIGIIFILVGGDYLNNRHRAQTLELLNKSKALLAQAIELKIPDDELASIKTLISRAEESLRLSAYHEAREDTTDAIQQLEYLIANYKPDLEGVEGRFAKLVEVQGIVEIQAPNLEWTGAEPNQILRHGTKIRTQRASTAKLKFDDGSMIDMKANSLIVLRELIEDEVTQSKSSNIELGISDIEALIKESRVEGSSFMLTMPDSTRAEILSETNLAVSVDKKNKSIVKVFMGRIEIVRGEHRVALTSREAVILDPAKLNSKEKLTALQIPVPPRLIYPTNVQLIALRADTKNTLFFRWTSVKDIEKYRIEIAKDYYFLETVISESCNSNRFNLDKLDLGNFYWRVSSVDKAGLSSEASQFYSFRVVEATDIEVSEKDLTPPELHIEHISIMGHIVDISGKTEPSATLYVNEQKENLLEDGTFRSLVEFKEPGLHLIFIEAYDSAGNVATIRKEVNIIEKVSSS